MKSMEKPPDEVQTTIEEALDDLAADLVSASDDTTFFKLLLAAAPGQWLPVIGLCHDQDEIQSRLPQLERTAEGKLYVSWLPYPDSVYGHEYCTIIFFIESLLWSAVAIYNKGRYDAAKTAT